jgi:hypothetical protein
LTFTLARTSFLFFTSAASVCSCNHKQVGDMRVHESPLPSRNPSFNLWRLGTQTGRYYTYTYIDIYVYIISTWNYIQWIQAAAGAWKPFPKAPHHKPKNSQSMLSNID